MDKGPRCYNTTVRASLLVIAFLSAGGPAKVHASVSSDEVAAIEVDLDGDGKIDRAHLDQTGRLRVELATGDVASFSMPDPVDHQASLDLVRRPEALLLHARAPRAGARVFESLISVEKGRVQQIYADLTGPTRDGERSEHLEVTEERVVHYQTAPEIVRCDGERRLFVEVFDFAARRFRPVVLEPPAGRLLPSPTTITRHRSAPIGLFRFDSASTAPGAGRKADRIGAPLELEDGNDETAWVAGPAGAGKGQWVTARARSRSFHAKTILIAPGPGGFPRSLSIVTGENPMQRFSVLPREGRHPITVELPPIAQTSCVSIVLGEPPAAAGGVAGLGEVAIYTEADKQGGIDQLVERVAEGSSGSDAAFEALVKLGPSALPRVMARLEERQGEARGRLLRVLGAYVKTGDRHRELGVALVAALRTASSASERRKLVDALSDFGSDALPAIQALYTDDSETEEARADAASTLGRFAATLAHRSPPNVEKSLAILMEGAGRGSAPLRQATREALGAAGTSASVATRLAHALATEVQGRKAADLDEARVIDLVVPLGQVSGNSPEVARPLLAVWQIAPPSSFELRLRLLRALGRAGGAGAAAVLGAAVREEHEEVLRAVAAEGAVSLPGDQGRALLLDAARDRDPRVRSVAIEGLGRFSDSEVSDQLSRILREDFWPWVRGRAAEQLGPLCERQPNVVAVLRHAVFGSSRQLQDADSSEEVRQSALLSLDHCPHVTVAELKKGLSSHQPPSVRELGIALFGKRGGTEAAHAIAKAIDDVLTDPDADERSIGVMTGGLRALAHVGVADKEVFEVLGASAREPSSSAVRAAAMQAIGTLCPQGAQSTLQKGAQDSAGEVQRAALDALHRCRK
jgi:HEAT repeat protein